MNSPSPNGGKNPYTYSWSNGYTGAYPKNLSAGVYAITVTDECGVEAIGSYIIKDYKVEIEIDTDLYQGETTITTSPTSGEPPFSFSWSTNENTSSIKVTENGEYFVTVTDDNGCSHIESVIIDQNCPSLLINLIPSSYTASCNSTSGIQFVTPVSGTYPFELTIILDGVIVENTLLESAAEVLNYHFINPGNTGQYEVIIIDNCGKSYTETFDGCLTCDYDSGVDGDNLFITLFKEYITLTQECPCDNDCGFLGFTTDKVKLDVDKAGILNDPTLPFGASNFKIIWPSGETVITKSNINGNESVNIYGIEEYILSDTEYESGGIEITVQFLWDGEIDCEVTIPFSFGKGGYNGYFTKIDLDEGYYNPFPAYGNIFNAGTVACTTKCKELPIESGVLYSNEPNDKNDQLNNYVSKCASDTDNSLSYFRYSPYDYDDPCYGGGVLETYYETENGLIRGLKYIPDGVALGEELSPYPLNSSYDNYSEFTCDSGESNKGYCLFDGLDVYGVSLKHKLLVEFCESFFYDPPVDTDGDGIVDEEDPCPLDPDVFCDPNDDDDDGTTVGGGGSNPNGCKANFFAETCQLVTVCPDGTIETVEGSISEQTFSGITPCIHCFSANICNVTDPNTGQHYSGLVGPVNENNIQIQTTYNEPNNCDDQCTVTFLCEGNSLGYLCGGVDCTTTNYNLCSYSQIVNIIESSLVGNDGSSTFVRSPKENKLSNFDIFPNPSNGSFKVEIYSTSDENQILMINNLDGKKIYNRLLSVKTGQNIIPLEVQLTEGIYLMSLISNQEIITIRHVVYK